MNAQTLPAANEQGRRVLAAAQADAEAFRDLFPRECYTRWTIAGSVRRRQPLVKDVDHVVMPAFGEVEIPGHLFGAKEKVNLLWHHLDGLLRRGDVDKHLRSDGTTSWGNKQRGCAFRGFGHEIFTADADNWGPQLAIRTGPAEYSHMLVILLQRHDHMNQGGYVLDKRTTNCACGWSGPEPAWVPIDRLGDGHRHYCLRRAPGRDEEAVAVCPRCDKADALSMPRVSVPDEETYFCLCGLGWVPPEKRYAPPRKGDGHGR